MKYRKLNRVKETLKEGVKYVTKYLFPVVGYASGTAVASGIYRKIYSFPPSVVEAYGFPLAWLERITKVHHYAHTYPPPYTSFCYVNPQNLALDIIFWSLIYGLPIAGWFFLSSFNSKV